MNIIEYIKNVVEYHAIMDLYFKALEADNYDFAKFLGRRLDVLNAALDKNYEVDE